MLSNILFHIISGVMLYRFCFLFVVLCISTMLLHAQQRIRVAVAGDFMCHDTQIAAALQEASKGKETYDFTSCYDHISPLIQKADFAFGNLETVLAGKRERYTGYPMFNSPDAYAVALKNAGFDALTTANNHSYDRRYVGIQRTLKVLDSLGIPHTGTTESKQERSKPLVVNVAGIRLGIIAFTYNLNDGPPPQQYRTTVNIIDTALIRADIAFLRSLPAQERPDIILASVHWGSEYELQPRADQRAFADWLVRAGANALLGAHPHVVQTVEKQDFVQVLDGKLDTIAYPVVYSMGNFISAQRTKPRDAGSLVWLDIAKDSVSGRAKIIGQGFTPTYVWRPRTSTGKLGYKVLSVPQALKELEVNPSAYPADVAKRLQEVQRDITKQFSTPTNAFRLIE
ncbi:MAG: CapA family protein [Candidatus Kapaibacterium sp.]|nr:MAG: CapA family protein [Candidatus Kapabacteria bacterium]